MNAQLAMDLTGGRAASRGRRRVTRSTAARGPDQLAFTLVPPPDPAREKRLAGALAYQAGLAAEEQVERVYACRGACLIARRWKSRWGEIDLIFKDKDRVLFVEVKRAKRHDWALERVSPKQIARIHATAELYLDACENGSLTEARVDVATVDGTGDVRILENAFM